MAGLPPYQLPLRSTGFGDSRKSIYLQNELKHIIEKHPNDLPIYIYKALSKLRLLMRCNCLKQIHPRLYPPFARLELKDQLE